MPTAPYNLAIETATPPGSIALGHGGDLLGACELPRLAKPRHRVDLIPTIDHLCHEHGVTANHLGELYVSIGPGSFTGLRIAIATAKILAQIVATKIVTVPTLDAVAQNAPPPCPSRPPGHHLEPQPPQNLVVCLASKRDTVYGGIYTWSNERWFPEVDPAVRPLSDLTSAAGEKPYLLGHPLPSMDPAIESAVDTLPARLAVARSEVVWAMGRQGAAKRHFVEPGDLAPLYARPPEAVELWDKRQAADTAATEN